MKNQIAVVALVLLMTLQSHAQNGGGDPFKTTGEPIATLMNINDFSFWVRADGWSGRNPWTEQAGGIYPRGTAPVIFQDGIVWGGFVQDGQEPALRIGGQKFVSGTLPGRIISKGIAEDPDAPDVRIWRIRPDWQTADLTQDAAEFYNVSIENVTENQVATVRAQYETDWNEWPWQKGAPFYDSNMNGIMDPDEEPGLAEADQVVWFVANDLDSAAVDSFSGSPPIGLEMQVTLWAYQQPEVLRDVIFKRYRLIYKGTDASPTDAHIDSMYLAQYSEPDVGAYADDFAGCDSLRSLFYAYNATLNDERFDEFQLAPPAIGYDFVQGPRVQGSPNDVAIFDFGKKAGYRNLPMTSFINDAAGSAFDLNPAPGPFAKFEWFNLLRGFPPSHDIENPGSFIDPITGKPTKFMTSGDPVTGQGWIDGITIPPGNREFQGNTGPFRMALGDTQEVVIALMGAVGKDHILSIKELRKTNTQTQNLYNSLFMTKFPEVSITPDYTNQEETKFTIRARAEGATMMSARIDDSAGQNLDTIPLFDDGAHQDSLAGDGIFGNIWTTPPIPRGVSLGVTTISLEDDTLTWPGLIQQIPTFGPVQATELIVSSDNINHNGAINPWENIRLTARLGNASNQNIEHLNILLSTNDPWVETQDRDQSLDFLAAGDTLNVVYDSRNPETYSVFQIAPNVPEDHLIKFDMTLYDHNFNLWENQKTLTVQPFPIQPEMELIQHVEGPANGTFGLYILEPSALTGHSYRITINDPSGKVQERTLNLIDMTTGDTLLKNHSMPDEFSHNIPITDGFKLNKGTLTFELALDQLLEVKFSDEPVDPPRDVWHQPNSNGTYALSTAHQYGNFNALTRDGENLPFLQDHDLELRFTESGGYGWWRFEGGGTGSVPFELWDIGIGTPDDPSDDVRLIPVLFANGVTPELFDINASTVDRFFNQPTTDWIYFYAGDYAAFEADAMDGALNDPSPVGAELLSRLAFVDLDEDGQIPPSGTTVRITTVKPPTQFDVYEFIPVYTDIADNSDADTPERFELFQNYPNPFNPRTTIRYHLSQNTQVTLTIFNVLGQQVAQLVDKEQAAGKYSVQWDGKSEWGHSVSSGVYFYKLKTETFTKVEKMLLVR